MAQESLNRTNAFNAGNDKIEQTCKTSTKVASRILTRYVGVLCPSLRMAEVSPDVSRGGTSATQRQKFHTDDVKSVWNPVRSADWSTE